MKTDVAINVHYNTLVKVQLFKDCDKALLRDLVLQLKPVLFLPGDYICRKGEVGKEMYIVNKGLVQVTDGDNGEIVLATLSEGSVFGEISLLGIAGCSRRTADVRSQGFSNLFVLSKDDLWEALKNYPEAQKVLRKKAKLLIKENEARDRASKNNNVKGNAEVIIKHEIKKPTTPQLLKTVMQVVPKDSKCAQMLVGRRLDTLPSVDSVSPKMSNLPSNLKIIPAKRDAVRSAPIPPSSVHSEKNGLSAEFKPRPESAITPSILPSTKKPKQCLPVTVGKDGPDTQLPSSSDPQTGILSKVGEDPKDLLKTIRNLLPGDFYKKGMNVVHPKGEEYNKEVADKPKPIANSSEDSGISVDLKLNSSVHPLQRSQEDSCSTGDSEDTSEISAVSSRRIKPANQETTKEEPQETEWSSPASSVFSLQALFRTNSSKSFALKDMLPTQMDVASDIYKNRSGSLTSSSTSAGYDNLAFVPADIFSSRRSSMFSDTSC